MNINKLNSRVGFGTASLHHTFSMKERLNLLDVAYDSGIKYFDTAPLYGHGSSERVLGKFIKNHSSSSPIVVASKVGLVPNAIVINCPFMLYPYIFLRKILTMTHLTSQSVWQPVRNYSKEYVIQQVERTLSNMRLDYLDVVYLHEPYLSDLQSIDDLSEAVLQLKKRGLLKMFGISSKIQQAKYILNNYPELAEVLQVEVSEQLSVEDGEWLLKNADSTFGHFRMSPYQNNISLEERLKYVVDNAVRINRSSTILFSSTKSSNIKQFVESINYADSKFYKDAGCL